MKGYQFLQNDFFELCETRKIKRLPMLLYIYLRGLYCRFQKPTFFWQDRTTRLHLGITQTTLSTTRNYLQERGLMKYMSGTGRTPTHYIMLGTVMNVNYYSPPTTIIFPHFKPLLFEQDSFF